MGSRLSLKVGLVLAARARSIEYDAGARYNTARRRKPDAADPAVCVTEAFPAFAAGRKERRKERLRELFYRNSSGAIRSAAREKRRGE